MKPILPNIQINVNQNVYLKNPKSSELGNRIVTGGIELIHQLGIEKFNFKKLGIHIQSTEASIYRYFENKHKLLLYITDWYWRWLGYRLLFRVANFANPMDKLRIAINVVTEKVTEDSDFSHIDEVKLNQIIISDSIKAYQTKEVDAENQEGLFSGYKSLVAMISDIILEINPTFKYPHMLVSTVIEGAHHQRFFAKHLPRLTDEYKGEDSIVNFYQDLVFNTIR